MLRPVFTALLTVSVAVAPMPHVPATLNCNRPEAEALRGAPAGVRRISKHHLAIRWSKGIRAFLDSGVVEGELAGVRYQYCGFALGYHLIQKAEEVSSAACSWTPRPADSYRRDRRSTSAQTLDVISPPSSPTDWTARSGCCIQGSGFVCGRGFPASSPSRCRAATSTSLPHSKHRDGRLAATSKLRCDAPQIPRAPQ